MTIVVVHLWGDPTVLHVGPEGTRQNAPFHDLDGRVAELRVVGDAYAPRRIHDAILEGTRAARAL
jgi:hypothetical protein